MFDMKNQNDVDIIAELYDLFDFDENSDHYHSNEVSLNEMENSFHFDFDTEDTSSISTIISDITPMNLIDTKIQLNNIDVDQYSYSLINRTYNNSSTINLLPRYKSLQYHSLAEIPYNIERLFAVGNVKSLNKLIEPYCDKSCMVYFPEFNLTLNGFKFLALYLQAILSAKPDLILKLDKTHVNGDLLQAKFYTKGTDSQVLNKLINNKYKMKNLIEPQQNEYNNNMNSNNNNNNNMNDDSLFNLKVASPRLQRIYSKLVMKKNKKHEINKIIKLLDSDQEILLTGISHLNFKINKNMISDIYVQSYITNVTAKS